jgi:divalent metal cation (Fe/Co/Zn/Cd) transporter
MDSAIPVEEQDSLREVLDSYTQRGIQYNGLRTRQSGAQQYVSFQVIVPGEWTVQQGHDLLEEIEIHLHRVLPNATVLTHMEPAP